LTLRALSDLEVPPIRPGRLAAADALQTLLEVDTGAQGLRVRGELQRLTEAALYAVFAQLQGASGEEAVRLGARLSALPLGASEVSGADLPRGGRIGDVAARRVVGGGPGSPRQPAGVVRAGAEPLGERQRVEALSALPPGLRMRPHPV
jgi:hypothetical protein